MPCGNDRSNAYVRVQVETHADTYHARNARKSIAYTPHTYTLLLRPRRSHCFEREPQLPVLLPYPLSAGITLAHSSHSINLIPPPHLDR